MTVCGKCYLKLHSVILKYKRLYYLQCSHIREMVAVRNVTFHLSTRASCTNNASFRGRYGSGALLLTTMTETSSTATVGSS